MKKITSVFLSTTTALWLSGATMLMPVVTQAATTVEELQAQIQALLAQITALQSQLATLQGTPTAVCGYTFSADMKVGSTGADVKNLQTVLNSDAATQLATSGAGSPGNETSYFGSITKGGVIKFQDKYASEVLTPIGLLAGTGYVGSMTRAKLNSLYGTCATTPDDDDDVTTPVAGTGLTVAAATTQPVSSLFPHNSTRVPFTLVDFTAGSDGAVTVNSLVIERTGLADDNVFSGVLLLDEEGAQIGLAKTLNSLHQVILNEPFTVPAGTTRTMTIAGNAQTAASTRAGQVAYLSLVSVNTSATVTGALPITGSSQTVAETLTIGSVTRARGPLDPGASATKEIGTTGYTFSSIKITAGSAEKVRLLSIRWNQSGSAASSDLANVKTYVDGVAYDTVLDSTGKYYTSTFNDGILIDKGFSKEVSIKGDIVGGSARTVDFDVYKRTDLYLKGETFGYGLNPPNGTSDPTDDSANFSNVNPWYDAAQVTVSSGTLNVTKAASIVADNIAINLADQVLGGFQVEVKGEEISVAQTIFHGLITQSGGTGVGTDIDSVSLYDENGNVVAGPVDATGNAANNVAITFTDTVTHPVGKTTYILKGKLSTNFGNNDTFAASTTPNSSDWTTVTGLTTGNTITPTPSSAVVGNTMTVKASSLTVSVSAAPVAQTVVAGVSEFTFARYVFDCTQSGEDIKITNIPLSYNVNPGTATDLTSCQLWDGTTALNTGSNIVNPSAAGSSTTFTFDGGGLNVPKGTAKTLSLKCDIAGNAASANIYLWGISGTVHQAAAGTYTAATGVTSGQTVVETFTTSEGQAMTIGSGALTVSLDASSPSYALAAAGSEVTLGVLKFEAANEAIELERVALQFSSTGSNTPIDLVDAKVTLWDGTTQVGEAVFAVGDFATSTLTGTVVIPKDGYKRITLKGTVSGIGVGGAATQGHFVAVNYDGADSTGTRGIGQSGGGTVNQSSSSDTSSAGVRIFRSVPTFAKLTVPSSKFQAGDIVLYRWSITADSAGDVGISKFTFHVASTASAPAGVTSPFVDDLNVYAYTDSGFSNPVSGIGSSGQFFQTALDVDGGVVPWASADTDLEIMPQTTGAASTTVQIPAGYTRYFELRGTGAVPAGTQYSVATQIQGDAQYIDSALGFMGNADAIHNNTDNDFVWSANATTSSAVGHDDWTNGYGISGLPAGNMSSQVLTQ